MSLSPREQPSGAPSPAWKDDMSGAGATPPCAESTGRISVGRFVPNFFTVLRIIDAGQLPPDSDVPAITGALFACLKGIAAIARNDLCQAELLEIASCRLLLLPPKEKIG